MSGGERKILAFVRAMIKDTKLITLDETSRGVQAESIENMASTLCEKVNDGAGILLIEQNINFLMRVVTHLKGDRRWTDCFGGIKSGLLGCGSEKSAVCLK